MHRVRTAILAFLLIGLFGAACYGAESITLWDGVTINVEVRKTSQEGAVVLYRGKEILLEWSAMPVVEAMRVWRAHMDEEKGRAWFELASFALENGYKAKAREFFAKAVELNPQLKHEMPQLDDPDEEKKQIIALLNQAQKAEGDKEYEKAMRILSKVLNWPNQKVLEEALMDTDFLNTALLLDHIKRLKQEMFADQGYSRIGQEVGQQVRAQGERDGSHRARDLRPCR
ncbi:MAG: tetratricopeptide repeat protein [Planctomycetota bacterium]|nr:tetratricopeptide repeat protein [Planctomycetota bacterium]